MSATTEAIAQQRTLLKTLGKRAYLLSADLASNTLTDEGRARLENQMHQVEQQQQAANGEIAKLQQQPQQQQLF